MADSAAESRKPKMTLADGVGSLTSRPEDVGNKKAQERMVAKKAFIRLPWRK